MTKKSFKDLLDPKVAAQVGKINLLAKRAVEGFITGLHKSPHLGFAIEFAEHRPYSPGDDTKRIDWLAYARTDKFFVKLDEQQTNLHTQVILDASESMNYSSDNEKYPTKFQYARYLSALLSYLMFLQQDAVGISVFSDYLIEHTNPSTKLSSLQRIFDVLTEINPSGITNIADVLHNLADRLSQRGLIIIISDLLDDTNKIIHAFQHFVFKKHQLMIFHILDNAELTLPFTVPSLFVDPETQEKITLNPNRIRDEYLDTMNAHIATLRRRCSEAKIEYILVNTTEPYDRMLIRYLTTRNKIIKRK